MNVINKLIALGVLTGGIVAQDCEVVDLGKLHIKAGYHSTKGLTFGWYQYGNEVTLIQVKFEDSKQQDYDKLIDEPIRTKIKIRVPSKDIDGHQVKLYANAFRYLARKNTDVELEFYSIDRESRVIMPQYSSSLFYNASSITHIKFDAVDTSNVTDMSCMFYGCGNLTSLDLSNFNTSNVTNMSCMFSGCNNLTSLNLSNFNTSNVTDMAQMFSECRNLTSLDVSKFNTSKVTDMAQMFSSCRSLTSLDVRNFDTSSVWSMQYMFDLCENLKLLDVSKFSTSNVTNMGRMFYGCKSLTSLDVSKFNTSKVNNMACMFSECRSLTSLDVRNFDTSNVARMSYMFSGMKLASIDLSNFNTSNVITMEEMFANSKFTHLDLSNFNTDNLKDANRMFSGCTNLKTLVHNFNLLYAETEDMYKGIDLKELKIERRRSDQPQKDLQNDVLGEDKREENADIVDEQSLNSEQEHKGKVTNDEKIIEHIKSDMNNIDFTQDFTQDFAQKQNKVNCNDMTIDNSGKESGSSIQKQHLKKQLTNASVRETTYQQSENHWYSFIVNSVRSLFKKIVSWFW